MIKYSLRCSEGHNFEAWFSSFKAYEDQVQDSLVLCPLCDSREIKKNIMSPNIGKKGVSKEKEGGKLVYKKKQKIINTKITQSCSKKWQC